MPDQHPSALHYDGSLRICHYIGDFPGHLHQVRLHIEASLSGTGSSNHDHIFIPGILRKLRPAVHCQPLRLCQDDVILKNRIYKWLDVLRSSPSGGAIFFSVPELFQYSRFRLS